MPLHIDYRPASFDEMVGNDGVIESLESIFDREDDIPHSFLFHGPSGCGKTTLARIVAEQMKCGKRDIVEINSSNNRGIDTAREIMKTMAFRPIQGNIRCYILDEVHKTTKDFQNAILKALEDTPKHVYFLLCTTDPQMLLEAILTRCSKFEVKALSRRQLRELLTEIIEAEDIKDFPKDVIAKIAEVSDGCPRTALVTLDQVIDMDYDKMLEAVNQLRVDESEIIDLCRGLLKGTWPEVAKILKGIDKEPEKVRYAVLGYINSVALSSEKTSARLQLLFENFSQPFYNSGKAGLTFACHDVFVSG